MNKNHSLRGFRASVESARASRLHKGYRLVRAVKPIVETLETRVLMTASAWNNVSSATASWNVASNWNPNTAYPNSASASASLNADVTVNQSISLGTNITVNALTLGDATQTGGVGQTETIAAGNTLTFDNGGGTAALTLASGAVAGATVAAPSVLNSDLTITNNSSQTLTISGSLSTAGHALRVAGTGPVVISGAISGSGSLTQAGSGMLTLSGSNTYSGGTTISSGSIRVNAIASLPTSGAVSVTSGAMLVLNAGVGSGAVNYNAMTLSGSGLVQVANLGTGSNSTVLDADTLNDFTGTLEIGPAGANGQGKVALRTAISMPSASATVKIDTGATLYLASTVTLPSTVQLYGGTTGEALGQLRMDSGPTVSGNVTLFANATVGDSTGTGTLTGTLTGGFALTKQGNATLLLTGANTYSGVTTISSGVLQIGNGGTSGTLGTGAVTNNASLVINRGDSNSITNAISGSGSLTLTGGGTVALSGSNSYSGATTISSGLLQINGTGVLGAGSYGGSITDNGAFQFNSSASQTFSSVISGSGSFTMGGSGTLTLTGASTYSGATTLNSGGIQLAYATGKLPSNSAVTINAGASLATNGSSFSIGSLSGSGTITTTWAHAGTDTLSIGNDNTSTTFSGTIAGSGGYQAIAIAKIGTGTLNLSGANTYTGATTISGGALQIGGTGTLGGGNYGGAITDNGSFQFNSSANQALSAAISGSGSFTMGGSGVLTLTGASTYTGATTIASGVIKLSNNTGALPSNGAVTINSGAELTTDGSSFAIGSLSGAGTITTTYVHAGIDTLTIGNNNASTTFSGTIAGGTGTGSGYQAIAIVKAGSGTLTLTGSNTYTGDTKISGGAVQIGNGGAVGSIGTSGGITDNATVIFNRSDNITVSSAMGGSGGLVQNGSGTLTLSGINNFTGGTTVNAGAVVTPSSPLPSPWAGGGVGTTSGSSSISSGTFTVTGTGTVAPTTSPYSYVGSSSDAFNLTYQTLGSAQEISTKVTSQQNTASFAKAGVMIRGSGIRSSAFVGLFATPGYGVVMLARASDGAASSVPGWNSSYKNQSAPVWVKLTTQGGVITGYASVDGTHWAKIGSISQTFGSSALAGVAADSLTSGSSTATFTNVSVGALSTAAVVPAMPYDLHTDAFSAPMAESSGIRSPMLKTSRSSSQATAARPFRTSP